jgi:hypothetical protein
LSLTRACHRAHRQKSIARTGLLSSMKSSRHSGNNVHCPRSTSSTKRLINRPQNHRRNIAAARHVRSAPERFSVDQPINRAFDQGKVPAPTSARGLGFDRDGPSPESRVQMRASQAEDADLARTENLFNEFGERPGNGKPIGGQLRSALSPYSPFRGGGSQRVMWRNSPIYESGLAERAIWLWVARNSVPIVRHPTARRWRSARSADQADG